jgi:hypothetical protein
MRPWPHRTASRGAVDRRQDQRHFRADARTEEAQELEQHQKEDRFDANAFAEAGDVTKRDTEDERYAKAYSLAESHCFADSGARSFCHAHAEALSVAFDEKGRQKEGFTEPLAERHTVSFAGGNSDAFAERSS